MASRWKLMRLALGQRAACDDDFPKGFRIYTGPLGGYEFGPYLPRTWRWALALKCCVCILLGREESDDWSEDRVELAVWDGEFSNGYPEFSSGFWEWTYLKVRFGWRPRTWRFSTGRDSSA